MRPALLKLANYVPSVADFLVGLVVLLLFTAIRLLPTKFAIGFGGSIARLLGYIVPRSSIALKQIAAAFPKKTAAEHKAILLECWDNLGRTCVEYCHLDRIWDYDLVAQDEGHIEVRGVEHFQKLRHNGKPAIIVSAHLANWELP